MPVMPTPHTRVLQERYDTDPEFNALCKLRAVRLGRSEVRPYDLHEVAVFYELLEALNLRVAPVVLPLDAPMMFTGNVVVCGVCRATFSDPDAIVRAQQHSWNDHSWLRPIMREPVPEPHVHCDNDPIECSVQAMEGDYAEAKRQVGFYKVALKAFALFIRSRQPSLHEYALAHRKTHPDCYKGPHDSYGFRLIKGGVRCLRCGTDVLRNQVS